MDEPTIVSFLDTCGTENPGILAYHYPFYLRMLEGLGLGDAFYFAALEGQSIRALLPLVARTTGVGSCLSSLPFFGPNAGVLRPPERSDLDAPLLRKAKLFFRTLSRPLSFSVYSPYAMQDYGAYDDVFGDGVCLERSTQFLCLDSFAPSSSLAYDLRKARQAGVEIITEVSSENVATFYDLYKSNCAEFGIPLKPFKCIQALAGEAVEGGRVRMAFAFSENRMVGGLMVLFGPSTASYYIPATLTEARSLQANTLLIDYMICEAKKSGLRHWNWEASPSEESGVYRFKKKWGSESAPYRVYVDVADAEAIKGLGREGLTKEFPNFFVYPFDRLENAE